ncbi:hypothetical protein DCAR_0728152 [Daucus carota subsp. sativus]|uniref:Uncharacterized protein n=1 Tax=Daucus carota subsp. sativus TaxID=79200 RepID=A0AAF1B761_DAUCS|nr:hypothetical protein DCAR_0728152 [Daucus carota subsp. sativus]
MCFKKDQDGMFHVKSMNSKNSYSLKNGNLGACSTYGYATQCEECFKSEGIRANATKDPFVCNKKLKVTCDVPAVDNIEVLKTPPGFLREVSQEGLLKNGSSLYHT